MKSAWIRLRHLTPIVGTKTVVDSSSASSYRYQYHVPSSPADAEKWANETIVWSKEKKTVLERDDGLKVHWWTPADMHYDYELHVGPDVQDGVWHFLRVPCRPFSYPRASIDAWLYHRIIAGHHCVDARGVVQLFSHFLTYLEEQVQGKGIDVKTLNWGDETPRLAPSSIVVALEAAGLPPSLESPAKPAPSTAADAAPPAAPVRSYSSDCFIISDDTAG